MTVDTPFPNRPATPFWDPRGVFASGNWGSGLPEDLGLAGLGDGQQTAARVLDVITAGAGAAERSLFYPRGGGSCPIGMVFNPEVWACQPGGTVTASASPGGVLIIIAIGLGLFFFARGR